MQIDKVIKREVISLIVAIILILTMFIGVSYSSFLTVNESENTNVIKMGDINFSFCLDTSCNSAISNYGQKIGFQTVDGVTSAVDIYPYDSSAEALQQMPYIFNIENTGTLKLYLDINLIEDNSFIPEGDYTSYTRTAELYSNNIKIGISRCDDGIDRENVIVRTYGLLENNVVLQKQLLEVGGNNTYCLWTWLDDKTPNEIQKTYFVADVSVTGEYIPYDDPVYSVVFTSNNTSKGTIEPNNKVVASAEDLTINLNPIGNYIYLSNTCDLEVVDNKINLTNITKDYYCEVRFGKEKYTLTYNNNGGSGCTSKQVNDNQRYGELCTPTRGDLAFLGWYTEKSGGQRVTSSTIAQDDVTVYAHWEKKLLNAIAEQTQGLDSVRSTYVTSNSGIDFTKAGGTTNGQGVYTRSGTENDAYPIYYYRGAVTNNNVIFGSDGTNKFCWKIVRTNDNGSIRMIYSGIAYKDENDVYTCTSNGTTALTTDGVYMNVYQSTSKTGDNYTYSYTNKTGYTTLKTKVAYNTLGNNAKYVGYMYENENENDTDSNIKRALEAWYEGALSAEDKLKVDTSAVYWNDREEMTTEEKTAYSFYESYTWYKGVLRAKSGSPSLTCTISRDCFTASNTSNKGNQKLTYPIGLLTVDEEMLAGRSWSTGMQDYLYNSHYYWLGSGYTFDSSSASVFSVDNAYRLCNDRYVYNTIGVRGLVSLLANTGYYVQDEESEAGTITNPYVVE